MYISRYIENKFYLKCISLTFSIYLIINNPIDIYFKNRIFSSVILPSVFMVLPHIDSSLIEGKNVLDIKRITFILQNIILNLLSIYKNEVVLKLAINVIYRINILEVLYLTFFKRRNWFMILYSIYLLTFNLSNDLQFTYNEHMYTTSISNEFILLYTLWFINFISLETTDGRNSGILHTLLPLIYDNKYWYTIRSTTGGIMLHIIYQKQLYPFFGESTSVSNLLPSFNEYYDQFVKILSGIYLLRIINNKIV